MNYELTLKGHIAYHSIRIVGLNTSMVLLSLYLVSIKNDFRKTADHLSWPEMTLATWRGVTDRNIPTQGVKSTYNPMFVSLSNVFLPKEAPFIFLPLTYNGGRKIGLTLGQEHQNSEICIL